MEDDTLAETKLGIMHQVNGHQWTWINAKLSEVHIL